MAITASIAFWDFAIENYNEQAVVRAEPQISKRDWFRFTPEERADKMDAMFGPGGWRRPIDNEAAVAVKANQRGLIYSHAAYDRIVERTMTQIINLGKLKGGEYAGDDDRLANFRRNADAAGVSMELIWRVYASKHWDAVMQYEKDLRTGKERVRLESIEGRVDDLIVYLLLFKAMIDERAVNSDTAQDQTNTGNPGTDI